MAVDTSAMVANFLGQQLTNSAEGQKVEQMKVETATKSLEAEQFKQLAPLQLQQKRGELQGQIDQQRISAALLPLQQQQVRDALSNAAQSGNPSTSGDSTIDQRKKRIDMDTQISMIKNPNQTAQLMAVRSKAFAALDEEAVTAQKAKLEAYTEGISQVSMADVIETAKRDPSNKYSKATIQYMAENPTATKDDLTTYLDSTFALTPKERAANNKSLMFHADTVARSDAAVKTAASNRLEDKAWQKEVHQDVLAHQNKEGERADIALGLREDAPANRAAIKANEKQDDAIKSYVGEKGGLGAYNLKPVVLKARESMDTIENIAGRGKPVSADNILDAITQGHGKDPAGKIDPNQVRALAQVYSKLSEGFPRSGIAAVKDILGHEYKANVLERMYGRADKFLTGSGSGLIPTNEDARFMATMVADQYKISSSLMAKEQLSKIQPVFNIPNVSPEKIIQVSKNMLQSDIIAPKAKGGTIAAMQTKLHSAGVKMSKEDEQYMDDAGAGFSRNRIPEEHKEGIISGVMDLYNKYAPQPQAKAAAAPTAPRGETLAGMPGRVSKEEQGVRDNTRGSILREERAGEVAKLNDPSPEVRAAAQRNIDALDKELGHTKQMNQTVKGR